MKQVDIKSFLIGVLVTMLAFVSIGADEAEIEDPKLIKSVEDNVIRVDFGTEQ